MHNGVHSNTEDNSYNFTFWACHLLVTVAAGAAASFFSEATWLAPLAGATRRFGRAARPEQRAVRPPLDPFPPACVFQGLQGHEQSS